MIPNSYNTVRYVLISLVALLYLVIRILFLSLIKHHTNTVKKNQTKTSTTSLYNCWIVTKAKQIYLSLGFT